MLTLSFRHTGTRLLLQGFQIFLLFLAHLSQQVSAGDQEIGPFIVKQLREVTPISGTPTPHGPHSGAQGTHYWIITFISARCPCSQAHQGRLFELYQEFGKDPQFQFVGVHANADEKEAESKSYFDLQKFPFPIFRDTQQKWLEHFPALKTPHVYIYSEADQKIVYQGGVDDSSHPLTSKTFYLREALEDLRAHQPIRNPKTRALGCQIRRRAG